MYYFEWINKLISNTFPLNSSILLLSYSPKISYNTENNQHMWMLGIPHNNLWKKKTSQKNKKKILQDFK